VLLYGDGFGTIVLAQTQTTPEMEKQLQQAQKTSQILGATTVDGAKALKIGTALGGVIVWQKGDTTIVAGGMVPMSDLEAFASSVR
jgi:methylmalonyl-CoA mutase cobalamin-binding subunit